MVTEETLQKIATLLVEGFDPERIILFGSYAREVADERSDIDLLVIGQFEGDRRDVMRAMDRSLSGLRIACDIVPVTPEEFGRTKGVPGTIARAAVREGKVLYART